MDQIPCEAKYRAPTDCLQYLTGEVNTFTSLNYPDYMPYSTQYMICIRQEEGFCGIAYTTNPQGSNEGFRQGFTETIKRKVAPPCSQT